MQHGTHADCCHSEQWSRCVIRSARGDEDAVALVEEGREPSHGVTRGCCVAELGKQPNDFGCVRWEHLAHVDRHVAFEVLCPLENILAW